MRPNSLTRSATLLAAASALLAAPGCVQLLPESEPSTIYRLLPSVPDSGPAIAAAGEIILVERPEAPRGLAGSRIATDRGEGQIVYIAGARWISPTPDMVQELVLDTFDRRLPGYTASRPGDGVRSRYVVHLEVRHFEAAYDQGASSAPNARVVLRARLVDEDARELVGVTTVRGEARADRNRQGAIVDAFAEAARQAGNELADWTQRALSAHRADRSE